MVRKLLLPSLLDVFFAVLLCAVLARPATLEALLLDGDTGWHIRTGEIVLATGASPQVDPFSFTRPNQPWIAWEWLADVLFAAAFGWRGAGEVAAVGGVALAITATVLFAAILRRGCGLWIALASALAAMSASSIHFLARPHVFSLLLYAVALMLLREDLSHRGRLVWIAVPLTALWANLHAGFAAWVATLGLLAFYSAVRREFPAVRRYGALTLACLAASLVNPYGVRLHEHIARYLNSPWILNHVQEFQSPQIRSEGAIVFAALLIVTLAASAGADSFDLLLVMVWGFAALRSARHVPFFAIAAAPVLASSLAQVWERAARRAGGGSPVRVFWELGCQFAANPRVSIWLPVSAAIALLTVSPSLGFSAAVFPVRAIEQNLPLLTPGTGMPRILTSDQWADYVIFRLYPRQRVFFDGRSDFYGPELGADYRKLLAGEDGWRDLVRRYGFTIALLPHDWVLSSELEREPGWHTVYRDSLALLLVRDAAAERSPSRVCGEP